MSAVSIPSRFCSIFESSGLPKHSRVQAQQIRTISKQRITQQILGRLDQGMMQLVDAAIKLHLGLD